MKQKNQWFRCLKCLLMPALLAAMLAIPAQAQEPGWEELLPPELSERVPAGLMESLNAHEALPDPSEITAVTQALSPEAVWQWLRERLTELLFPSLTSLGGLLSVTVLAAMLEQIRLGQENGSLGKALTYVAGLGMGGAVYRVAGQAWQTAVNAMEGQTLLMSGFVPLLTGAAGAAGQVSGAAVNATGMTLLTALGQRIGGTLLLPFLSVGFGLSLVSGVMPEDGPDLSGLGRCLKMLFGTGLTLLMTLFALTMTYQTVVAKSADGALLRTVRWAAGTLIPVVGGSLGEVLSGAMTGLRSVARLGGVLSSVSLLLAVLPSLLRLEAARLTLAITAGAAKLLGCGRVGAIAEEAGSYLGLATALTAGMGILFLYGIFLCVGGIAG